MGMQIERLARFVAETVWADVPEIVQRRTKLVLLDTLGVILAGAQRPEVAALRRTLGPNFGTGAAIFAPQLLAADPGTAAMLNAIAGRSVEMSEGLRGFQHAVHLVPGALAVAQQRRASGKGLLEALLLGYELGGRIQLGFTPHALAHPNGQLSLLSTVAAGARLHELDASGVALALRIGATMIMTPSYMNAATGGTALNLPAGIAAMACALAPKLALAGFSAHEDTVEESLDRLVGRAFDPECVADGLGETWGITDNYFRFYACCNPIHPALDALKDILDDGELSPEAIERIDVETFAFAAVMQNRDPKNYFASKYSLPHAAATLIVRHGLGFSELDDSALEDSVIGGLRKRVFVTEDPEMTAAGPWLKPARVTVRMNDGHVASAYRGNSRRDTLRADPEEDVRVKFHELAGVLLTPEGTKQVEAAVDRCETWECVDELVTIIGSHLR
jgi:2-methylcitrate dehydratase PrpD